MSLGAVGGNKGLRNTGISLGSGSDRFDSGQTGSMEEREESAAPSNSSSLVGLRVLTALLSSSPALPARSSSATFLHLRSSSFPFRFTFLLIGFLSRTVGEKR